MHPAPASAAANARRGLNPWPGRTFTALVAVSSMFVLYLSVRGDKVVNDFFVETHTVNVTKTIPAANRPKKSTHGMNILLLGIDSRVGLTAEEIGRYRLGGVGLGGSDTIMLVHLSPERDHATIISFPRDLYVTIPAYTRSDGKMLSEVKMKLNAAFPRGGTSDGPALSIITIEKLTGLGIDHYMSIDVPHLGRMVKAIGGVDVCLPQAIHDPVRNHHGSGLDLSAGRHTLNDVEAVGYVRTRYITTTEGNSDFGRIRRQQKFMASMLHKVTSLTVRDPSKFEAFLHTVADAVTMDTEMTPKDLFTMAQSLQSLDPKHVTFVTVPVANDSYMVKGVGSTVLADATAAQGLYDALRDDKQVGATDFKNRPNTLKPSDVSVQVLNGGAPAGSAAQAATDLAAMGFTSGGASGNAPTRDYATTTIRYAGAQISEARTVQLTVPGATLVPDDTATVVQLILGKDFTTTTPIPTATTPTKAVVTHTASENICTKN